MWNFIDNLNKNFFVQKQTESAFNLGLNDEDDDDEEDDVGAFVTCDCGNRRKIVDDWIKIIILILIMKGDILTLKF